jgi:sensor histidine kinase YesM
MHNTFNLNKKRWHYWLLQFTGWGLLGLVHIFLTALLNRLSQRYFLRLLIFIGLGILISHIIKIVFVKTNLFKKRMFSQIVAAVIITFCFSVIGSGSSFFALRSLNMLSENEEATSGLIVVLSGTVFYGCYLSIWVCIYLIYHYIQTILRAGQEKLKATEQLYELEAKALRAQMNPHFIFNCLNSIKSLIQEDKKELSVTYLTTFSKLIRTLFNNADKKEISLYDEIETCKLYLKLESMRFDEKFTYSVAVDPSLDLRSIKVPVLIIQPFIENSIIHGIMPKEAGGQLQVLVSGDTDSVNIIIDDNGIGREASIQNKSLIGLVHESRGVFLTQSRLLLNNMITKSEAAIEIVDKKSATGRADGTKTILKFKHLLS